MTTLLNVALWFLQEAPAAPPKPKSPDSPFFWMPTASSTTAAPVDWLFDVLLISSAISGLIILVVMTYFVMKYKTDKRTADEKPLSNIEHNTTLELTWSTLPMLAWVAFFVWGFQGYVDLRTPPKDALEIHAEGRKWNWDFAYPNGLHDGELHVPVDRDVRIVITSVDVLHSLFMPAFRTKMDAVPGRYTDLWFHATEAGEYPIFCAEYCGDNHSNMISKVVVHEPGGYEKWLESKDKMPEGIAPVVVGAEVYQKQGCPQCHTTDGTRTIGPSFKGMFGKTETFTDGSSAKVDENYIKESLNEPQAKVVAGYNPVMPTFKGKMRDWQITALIEYIKSLK